MKEELFRKCKAHIRYIEQKIKQNKKEKHNYRGHLIHNACYNPALGVFLALSIAAGTTVLLAFFQIIHFAFCLSIGCAAGFLGAFFIPKIIHNAILRFAKGKLGRGYAKLELDDDIKNMKSDYKDFYKNVYKAKSSDDVSLEELQRFAKKAGTLIHNAKYHLNNIVVTNLENSIEKDYNKIIKLSKKINNRDVLDKKIQKIIEKNNKFTEPWCEVFNSCCNECEELYRQAKELDSEFDTEDLFSADYQSLQILIAQKTDLLPKECKFDDEQLEEDDNRNSLQERQELLNKLNNLNNDRDMNL